LSVYFNLTLTLFFDSVLFIFFLQHIYNFPNIKKLKELNSECPQRILQLFYYICFFTCFIHLWSFYPSCFDCILFILIFLKDFYWREWAWAGKERGRGTSRLPAEWGSIPGPEIIIWAEVRCLTDWATQAPLDCILTLSCRSCP